MPPLQPLCQPGQPAAQQVTEHADQQKHLRRVDLFTVVHQAGHGGQFRHVDLSQTTLWRSGGGGEYFSGISFR